MNEDKMELEEAINRLKQLIEIRKSRCRFIDFDTCICGTKDIEIVLQALDNSISTKKIEDKIEELNEEFKNYKVDVNCSQDNYYELSDKYAFAEEKLRELLKTEQL